MPSVPPPSPTQAALVGRAALAVPGVGKVEEGAANARVGAPERVLKPFGVALLPSDERAGAERPPRDAEARPEAATT